MKKVKKYLSLLLVLLLSVCMFSAPVLAEEDYGEDSGEEHLASYYDEIQSNAISGWPQGDAVDAGAAILIDADTGAVLYAKSIDSKEYPASITKIMTALLALEKGNLSDVVTFSANAVYSIEFGSSHLGLTEGEKLTLEQCLYGILLASANEISNAVAEHIAGSTESFAEMMNEKAKALGCTNTHFVNVHGLHDENHYVCARDMALIMQEALKNEKFCEIIKTTYYEFPETNLVKETRPFVNHHKMIAEEGMLYDGCLGGKNGFTDEAMNTLVTAAERNGQKLICVVLRVPGQYVSYENTRVLLDYGFANFRDEEVANVYSQNWEITGIEKADELAKIKQADFSKEPFAMAAATKVTLPAGAEAKALKASMDFTAQKLTYYYEGQAVGSVPFTYTGVWETEAPTESETETQSETAAAKDDSSVLGTVGGFLKKAADGALSGYEKVDAFIEDNTIIAVIIGAVLLLIFIPLLFIAVNRQRKYTRIQELRREDLRVRRQLEAEIERQSAAQVEAELRARQLQMQLNEEKKKIKKQEKEIEELQNMDGYYLDDEYIEVPLEDGEDAKND